VTARRAPGAAAKLSTVTNGFKIGGAVLTSFVRMAPPIAPVWPVAGDEELGARRVFPTESTGDRHESPVRTDTDTPVAD